jgi:hypothetical protein
VPDSPYAAIHFGRTSNKFTQKFNLSKKIGIYFTKMMGRSFAQAFSALAGARL